MNEEISARITEIEKPTDMSQEDYDAAMVTLNDPETWVALRAALQSWYDTVADVVVNQVIPTLQRVANQLNATGFHITYEHPAAKHNGRRRSRREMRDIRQQAHFIHLADTIRKDGEQ